MVNGPNTFSHSLGRSSPNVMRATFGSVMFAAPFFLLEESPSGTVDAQPVERRGCGNIEAFHIRIAPGEIGGDLRRQDSSKVSSIFIEDLNAAGARAVYL